MPAYFEKEYGDCCRAFAASYDLSNLPAMLEVERSVLGCDYGGTSWTTRAQAADIAGLLELDFGIQLLDIGSGSGWPGLYFAQTSGCAVTLLDLPRNALGMAQRRAASDGLERQVNAVVASGHALPLTNESFEAITHSDVLCCMPEKTEMLAECRRVAQNGARMVFSVIALAPGLSGERRARAIDAGPPFVDAPADYDELLAASGWRILQHDDCTAAYRESLRTLVDALQDNDALALEMGADAMEEACTHRRQQIDTIDAGYLIRETFLATPDSRVPAE